MTMSDPPPNCVVDASVMSAILYVEPRRAEAATALEGARLLAPSLLPLEVANAGVKKVRGGTLTASALASALETFEALDVILAPIDVGLVTALAVETRLSAYDASYLWLAQQLGARLVTFDARLGAAFEKALRVDDGEENPDT
jgi:predicted nucleic acid-binding protein